MIICANCFNDNALIHFIQSDGFEGTLGTCPVCEKQNSKCFEAKQLQDYFTQVVDLYEISELPPSLLLHERLQCDWRIFNPQIIENGLEILSAIMDIPNWNQNLVKKWIIKEDITFQEEWDRFSEEIKHENRFFITEPYPEIPFDYIWGFLIKQIQPNTKLYRSRINHPGKRYYKRNLGKPPKKRTTSGRANPLGIPYLYLASNRDTAIAETRPAKGQSVTVGYFKAIDTLNIINFRKVSPFEIIFNNSYEEIVHVSTLNSIITLISERLALPIDPKIANLEYIPTQYICEMIKFQGYDGVAFQSAMGEGLNYAIFDDKKLNCYTSRTQRIKDLAYTIE